MTHDLTFHPAWGVRARVAVRTAIGGALLAAAALKLYGLGTSPLPGMGWFAQQRVQLLAAEWELVLGSWLLSGAYPRVSWVAALATFLGFAGVSGYLGWVGVASCGCLGAVKTNPWWMFAADVTAVGLLAVSRPREEPQSLRPAGVWVGSAALASAAVVAAGSLLFGSAEVALAKLRGDTLSASPGYVDFGAGKPGDLLEATASVTNYTNEPVRLIGGTADCSCATVADFPLTIPPGDRGTFRLTLAVLGDGSGQQTRTVAVRTDCPKRPVIHFRIGCTVEK